MVEMDETIASAVETAGYRVLTPDGVQRRYRSAPIDALAEPKSASVRLTSCVRFECPEQTGKPFINIGGSAVAVRHDRCSDPLLPEVGAIVASPLRAGSEKKNEFTLAAIEMQLDCVRMTQGGDEEVVAVEAGKHIAKWLERAHFKFTG